MLILLVKLFGAISTWDLFILFSMRKLAICLSIRESSLKESVGLRDQLQRNSQLPILQTLSIPKFYNKIWLLRLCKMIISHITLSSSRQWTLNRPQQGMVILTQICSLMRIPNSILMKLNKTMTSSRVSVKSKKALCKMSWKTRTLSNGGNMLSLVSRKTSAPKRACKFYWALNICSWSEFRIGLRKKR